MEKVILLGCGGHAKSVIDAIEAQNQYMIAGFVDTQLNMQFEYQGYGVIGTDNDLKSLFESGVKHAFVCVGYLGTGNIREKLYKQLKDIGFNIITVIDPSAIIAKDVIIEEGVFIGKSVVLNSHVVIEKMTIINTGAIIEHDCYIKAYTHVAVGAILCGHVQVGQKCLIGAGATIIQERQIGDCSIVAAGAVVIRNVLEKTKIIGQNGRGTRV